MTERKSMLWGAALILPLLGFGYTWATTHSMAQKGTDWDVPVMGYDPRDLLRGHYITYRYDWPGLKRDQDDLSFGYLSELCIEGTAPTISRVTVPNQPSSEREGEKPAPPPKCTITARSASGSNDSGNGLESGTFYVPQAKAADYEKKLADPKLQGVIRLRIRDDGVAHPIGLTFRKRPAGLPEPEASTAPIIRAVK